MSKSLFETLDPRVLFSALSFAPQVSYQVGSYPGTLVVADLNGDGKPDIVTASSYHYAVSVLLNNGDGTFKPQATYDVGTIGDITVGDVNGDGIPDLIVVGRKADVFLGNGDGTFAAPITISLPPYSEGPAAIGDLNGDGEADLVVAGYSNTQAYIIVLLGNGDGTFALKQTYLVEAGTNPEATDVQLGDLNGDGKLDAVVATKTYSTPLVCLLGTGDGTFEAARTFNGGVDATSVTLADVNGDGFLDAISSNYANKVGVALGTGDGRFLSATTYAVGASAVSVGDLDEDGLPDLAIAGISENAVQILTGTRDGRFDPAPNAATGIRPVRTALVDLNGDGVPDLVTANAGNNSQSSVSVLLNTSGATPLLSFSTTNHILTATANSDHPDDILLSRTGGIISLSDSGDVTTYQASSLSQININTGAGNDVVTIEPGIGLPVSVNGGAGHDILAAHGPNITLAGGKGWDNLTAHGQDDVLIGGLGNDTITAGPTPTDTLRGGAGNDSLTGGGLLLPGTGDDTLVPK